MDKLLALHSMCLDVNSTNTFLMVHVAGNVVSIKDQIRVPGEILLLVMSIVKFSIRKIKENISNFYIYSFSYRVTDL